MEPRQDDLNHIRCADAILRRLAQGPAPTQALASELIRQGWARTTVERAKRELLRSGRVRVYRVGTRTNPYTIEAI